MLKSQFNIKKGLFLRALIVSFVLISLNLTNETFSLMIYNMFIESLFHPEKNNEKRKSTSLSGASVTEQQECRKSRVLSVLAVLILVSSD